MPDNMLSPATHKRSLLRFGLRRVVEEGLASQAMEAVTTGVFLVGIALHLGAPNILIGVLGAIPFLSNLFQIPAIILVEKYRDRRKIVVTSCFIGRSFLLLVAAAPLVHDKHIALTLVVLGMTLRYCAGAMATCAWNSWMRDLVPQRLLGRFFGRRLFYLQGVMLFLTLAAGFFIDAWKRHQMGDTAFSYAILYVLGFFLAMISTWLITTIPHPTMVQPVKDNLGKHFHFADLKKPLQHKNFRQLTIFLITWNFAANLVAPFFTVYLLKTLGFNMTFVVALTLLSQGVNVISLRIWGKYSDSYSNKTVLRICGTLFIFCILGWTFTAIPDKYILTIPLLILLHILMGIATAGILLTSGNIALKLAPAEKATSFLAMNTMLSSLAAGIAPLIGGVFADVFEHSMLSFDIHWQQFGFGGDVVNTISIGHWNIFFFFSFLLGLFSLSRLARVEEKGSVKGKVVMKEIVNDTGRILRSLSSIGGLRSLTMAPMAMIYNIVKKKPIVD